MEYQKPTKSLDNRLTLVIGVGPARHALLFDLLVTQALRGPVCVLDAGNRFKVHRLTRPIRRETAALDAVLGRIQVARAFTCFQVLSLLGQTQAPVGPVFVLDLLTTFSDESVSQFDREILLQQVWAEIARLQTRVPVVVSVRRDAGETDFLDPWITRLRAAAAVCHQLQPELSKPAAVLF